MGASNSNIGPFKKPFRVEEYGLFIYDDNGQIVIDLCAERIRPRAWGYIQYLENAEQIWKWWENLVNVQTAHLSYDQPELICQVLNELEAEDDQENPEENGST